MHVALRKILTILHLGATRLALAAAGAGGAPLAASARAPAAAVATLAPVAGSPDTSQAAAAMALKRFDKLDLNKDGIVTLAAGLLRAPRGCVPCVLEEIAFG